MHTPTLDLVGSAEASRILGVSVWTVARWAKADRLTPATKAAGLRGPLLFHRADVEDLAAARALSRVEAQG